MQDKSVLDGVPVAEKNWSLPDQKKRLDIVGSCPTCGNPIYGEPSVMEGDSIRIERSCPCNITGVFTK